MKRILIANNLLQGGGVEKLMYDFAINWSNHFNITILTEYKEKEFYDIYPKHIRHIHYHPKNNLEYKKGLRKLGKCIKLIYRNLILLSITIKKYDVVVAMKEGTVTKYLGKIKATNKLGWVHADYYNNYWTNRIYTSQDKELCCMKSYNKIICVSNRIKESIKNVIGDSGNLVVRENPINVEEIRYLAQDNMKEDNLRIPSDKILFVTIGRLHYQKGYDLLLEACHKLEQDKLSFEVWIIGSGKDEIDIKKIWKKRNIKSVKFLGEKENPYSYLKHASWFISSSRYEGYSLVTQEAAVLGIPIIATDCSGVRELLGKDGEYGIIVDISVEEIYKAMKNVIVKPKIRELYRNLILSRAGNINYDERMKLIIDLIES